MNWIKNKLVQAKVLKALANVHEEALYAQAAIEVADGDIRPGLWAKALATTGGGEQRAKARYIGLRVEQLQLQLSAAGEITKVAAESVSQAAVAEHRHAEASLRGAALPSAFRPVNPDARIRCMKCCRQNVRPAARTFRTGGEGHAPYCFDCETYLYGREWEPVG